MGILQPNLISLITLIFVKSSLSLVYVNGDCSYSNCANNVYTYSHFKYDPIPFPFRTPDQEMSCGLPGFELGCNDSDSTPRLDFPSGQSFTVTSISNYSRQIEITDECLPQKLLEFNSSGTPFRSIELTDFTLYTCPLTVRVISLPLFQSCLAIGCDRERYNPVVCDAYSNSSTLILYYGCELIGNVKVVGSWISAKRLSVARSVDLTWDTPSECVECESKREVCGRHPSNYTKIKCFPRPSYKDPYETNVPAIVVVSFTLPIILALLLLCVCYIYIRCKQTESLREIAARLLGSAHGGRPPTFIEYSSTNQRSNVTQEILDAYPIVLVGDSGRILMNMEERTCSICLSDYETRDILKSLPECLHRFHSDCIDEWLRRTTTCPICRTIPPQTLS